MVIKAQNPKDWMYNFFGGMEVGNVEERGYKLRIAVAGERLTPRDETFEYFRDYGMNHLESILHQKPIGQSYIALVFPERWLSVHEQQHLVYSLDYHPEVKSGTLTAVDILTQNPLIVSGCHIREVIKFDMEGSRGLTTHELKMIVDGEHNIDEIYEMLSGDKE